MCANSDEKKIINQATSDLSFGRLGARFWPTTGYPVNLKKNLGA